MEVQKLLINQENLDIIEASVEDLLIKNNHVEGVFLSDFSKISSKTGCINNWNFFTRIN